jgi:1-deoxy-D-xylulose 5-phosphate reductoisomerase
MKRNLSILGSTGSIGTQTLDVVRELGLRVCALAANSNVALLENQIREFKPQLVAVFDFNAAKKLKLAVADTPVRIVQGMDGLCEAAAAEKSDVVLNSLVGIIGLIPTLTAIKAKKDIALANKETLVVGGELVMQAARENNVKILPVDSEHSAIFQCLQGCPEKGALKRIILTASGGPFFGRTAGELRQATPEQALNHPTWNMGAKVTIDSSTMMNKGFEIIEASWLFELPPSKIDVLVHRESVVHSMIEYQDNSVIAQMGVPDMRLPIQYALTWPQRLHSPVKQLSLTDYCTLSFYPPDTQTFPCLNICKKAIERGGLAPAAVNGANEVAVKLFLEHKISFAGIAELVGLAMENQPDVKQLSSVEDILDADQDARNFVNSKISK